MWSTDRVGERAKLSHLPATSQAKCASPLPLAHSCTLAGRTCMTNGGNCAAADLRLYLGAQEPFLCLSNDTKQGTRRPSEENTPEPNYASWFSLLNNER